ncbi:hypothetical protein GALMADRAFT_146600 [Galerina marginata CBS 339.88]|uniref:Uncharacterized protein n=1 Tax=Galerina marginata (strain CBS 339.88) TaxID=685588 RepID=A0A067SB68_GALM3|nr:hypothetical protein GALMADRAFT_146600 [Galerina marginata CBS 339.88]
MSSETAQTPRSRTWWLYIENQNPVPVIVIAPGGSRLTLAAGATYNSYTNGVHHVAAPGTPDVTYFKVHYEDLSNMSTEQAAQQPSTNMSSQTAQTPRSRTWWLYIENQNSVPVIVITPGGSRLTLASGATYNSYTNGVHHVAAPGTPDVTYFKVHYTDLSDMRTEQGPLNGLFTVKVEMSIAIDKMNRMTIIEPFLVLMYKYKVYQN